MKFYFGRRKKGEIKYLPQTPKTLDGNSESKAQETKKPMPSQVTQQGTKKTMPSQATAQETKRPMPNPTRTRETKEANPNITSAEGTKEANPNITPAEGTKDANSNVAAAEGTKDANSNVTPEKSSIIPSDEGIEHFFYKRTVDKKLTIFLLENTTQVAKEVSNVTKIIKSHMSSGPICIISYNAEVKISDVLEMPTVDISCYCSEDKEDKACLSDALMQLENLIAKYYLTTIEKDKERVRINAIDIVGIGTCMDNCSKVSREEGILCFFRIANRLKVSTKYFCLTDNSFVTAAEFGFHSIGAISKKY